MRILVTDGLQRKTLAALRALGCNGDEIILAEYTRINPSAFSKYVKVRLLSPNPSKDPKAYMDWLLKTLKTYEIELLVPMDDASMQLVVKHQATISGLTQCLVPELNAYGIASDKGKSVAAALMAGANCPKTYTPENLEAFKALGQTLEFPVLLKPRASSGSRGIRIIRTQSEFTDYCLNYHKDENQLPIIQQYIEQGTKYDVCMLYDKNGQLVASFVQEEIRQYPEPMGPSTMQRSVYNEALTAMAANIVNSIGWKGIAEVEFMKSPVDGKFYFMEINTRFWASLQCAISAGVNFPVLYRNCALDLPLEKAVYREHVVVRWLFPGDLLRFVTYGKKVLWEPSFFVGRSNGIIDDVYDSKDKAPVLGVLLTMLRFVFDLSMWKAFFWR